MTESQPKSLENPEDLRAHIESLEEGEVSLDFIEQTPSEDYSSAIRKVESQVFDDERALRANYDRMWLLYGIDRMSGVRNEEIKKYFDEALPGSVVCDLGGHNGGSIEVLAASRNADLFINVDKYPRGHVDDTPVDAKRGVFKNSEYKSGITDTVLVEGVHKNIDVRADMLDFVSRLKDSSVNISINGIDTDLIPDDEYHKSLAKEILRATKQGGIVFGNNSEALQIIEEMIRADANVGSEFEVAYNKGGVAIIRRK